VVLAPNMSIARQLARGTNTIFGVKNKATILKTSRNITKLRLFDKPNLFAFGNCSFESRDSKIRFLDERFATFIVGAGIRF
ncbi:MAG: hypothetical protein K2N20_01735, partial [Helicobacter sp.]|nr:hypothetical protein [Helicobacter sp.]